METENFTDTIRVFKIVATTPFEPGDWFFKYVGGVWELKSN